MARAVITGIGVVAPNGVGVDRFWESILKCESSIRRITRFDVATYPCQIGGEVDDSCLEQLLDPKILRTSVRVTRMALAAAQAAIDDARFSLDSVPGNRFGVVIGTALGGWVDAEQQYSVLLARGARRVNPFLVSGAGFHVPAVEVAGAFEAKGYNATISTGCVSSLQAIGHAAALIESGELTACLVGGAETPLTPTIFAALGRTRELSTAVEWAPSEASRPFDRQHSGIVLSEGSCILLLESSERVARRRLDPYAWVRGWSSSCDAEGLYGTEESGTVAAQSIHDALRRGLLEPDDLDYVCSHANSSPVFDRKESVVIKRAFGEQSSTLLTSSIKGVLGHPFGASGAFQTAATALAIRHATIPPTANLNDPDPACDLALIAQKPCAKRIRNALVTSYGYGGANTYLVLGSLSSQMF